MKKSFLLTVAIIWSVINMAQVPQSFNYQTIVRDSQGNIITEQPVDIKLSILRDSENGESVYSEHHKAVTNSHGLINLKIGTGNTVNPP